MGNWSNRNVVLKPIEFDGDSIVFSVKRLLVEEMQTLSKYHDKASGVLRFEDPLDVCKTAQCLLPRCLASISGMKQDDGTEVTLAEFLEASKEFYFVGLVGTLFAELISVSTIRSKEKNFVPPTPESSEALGGESTLSLPK